MGRGIRDAVTARGDEVVAMFGRADRADRGARGDGRPDPATLGPIDVTFEFSHAASVVDNVSYALATGCRAIVLGTTAWANDRAAVDRLVTANGATLVDAPSYSIGVVLFGELAESAARACSAGSTRTTRTSWNGTAARSRTGRPAPPRCSPGRILPHLPTKSRARLAEGSTAPAPDTLEIVSLRAGASPGMHVVGFDAPGESIELRITARDRSAYVAGAILAADWLLRSGVDRPVGLCSFDSVVRTILREPTAAASTPPASTPPSSTRSNGSTNSSHSAPAGAHAVTEAPDVLAR